MLRTDQIADYFFLKHELPNVECKGQGNLSDNPLLGKVVRAAIGMANKQDGGIVIIGIAEHDDHTLYPDGLTDEQLATWSPDLLADQFNKYASPAISFEYQPHQWSENSRWFIFLHINEFTDVPIICTREYKDNSNLLTPEKNRDKILKPGALYARSFNKAETKEITTVEALRDLLDLATAKGIRKFMKLAESANVSVSARQRDEELFQRQQYWSSKLVEQIVSRGYWRFIIRPQQFEAEHLEFSQMAPLVRQSALQLRYLFPPTSWEPAPPGNDWVGQEVQVKWRLEAWRLYQSGQFVLYVSLLDDWEDLLPYSPKPDGWQPGTQLSIEETMYLLVQIFEFAAQLGSAANYHLQGDLHIDIALCGIKGRALQFDPSSRFRPMLQDYVTNADEISYSENFTKEQLITQARELSLVPAIRIFQRFNWHPSQKLIRGIQAELPPI